MKQILTLSALLALFGLALSFGYASPAAAQVDDAAERFAAEIDALDHGRRGPAKPRDTLGLREACPCNGPDGNGWDNHGQFVQCVTDAAQAALDAGTISQEQFDKIVSRAARSEVGKPGFECPTRPERPEPREKPADLGLRKACPCNGPDGNGWDNHGQFVQCVTDAAQALLDAGTISQEQFDKIVSRAAQSEVGKPGFECPTRPEPGERPGPGRRGPGRGGPGGGR